MSQLGGGVIDAYLKHRKTTFQFDRAVLGTLHGAELGFQATIDFEGETGFGQFDCLARHSVSVVVGGMVSSLVTVSPAWPTSLFWGPRKEQLMSDSFDLRRFVDAQASIYPQVVEELSRGRKRSHWMWFVFPQIAGVGFSAMAQRFAIGSRAERPLPILAHDLLGPHFIDCTRLVMGASEKTINDILGSPDDMKFRSSMTLFDAVSKQEIFAEAIATFYPAGKDPATIEILRSLKD
jgi:uncharacterized protein (DUF1810 family)